MLMNTTLKSLCPAIAVCIIIIAFPSCNSNSTWGGLKTLLVLQDTLNRKYNAKTSVEMTNGNSISVTLINSGYNDSTAETQKRIVKEIKEVTSYVFKQSPGLQDGRIIFLSDHSFLIFSSTSSISYQVEYDIPDTVESKSPPAAVIDTTG
ncbi:MAG: hypothetical protein JWO03_3311 [Bacteroidetes bacterium]|nr:hypothetical protein [Bacteroidota bacterium]